MSHSRMIDAVSVHLMLRQSASSELYSPLLHPHQGVQRVPELFHLRLELDGLPLEDLETTPRGPGREAIQYDLVFQYWHMRLILYKPEKTEKHITVVAKSPALYMYTFSFSCYTAASPQPQQQG